MRMLGTTFVLLVIAVAGAGALVASGAYNVAADEPHWPVTHRLLEAMRDRSIEVRAAGITVPPLDDVELIRSGAGNFDAMCVGCHLAPSADDTELSLGLYPAPPRASALGAVDPRRAFWVIKHGVKMSGMPAWGPSMDDRYIWGLVAFLRQLPSMSAEQYAAHVASSPGHSHGGGERAGSVATGHDHQSHDDVPRSSFEPIEDPMALDGDPHHSH